MGYLDQAVTVYKLGIKLDPNFPVLRYNLGMAYYLKKEFDKALAELDTSLVLDRSLAKAYIIKAMIYFDQKNYPLSWENLIKAEGLGESYANLREKLSRAAPLRE